MMMEDKWDMALPSDRAGGLCPEPAAQSQPSALIPSAVGFTGTQHGCTAMQTDALRGCLRHLLANGYVWMRNGDCIGSDLEAAYTWQCYGGKIAAHPPTIAAKRAYVPHDVMLPERPYLDRNKDIVLLSEVMVATPGEKVEQLRGGTWSTIRFARRQRKPLMIIFPDGTSQTENGFAQAIEARMAETQGGSVHESAVAEGHAPHPNQDTPHE